MSQKQEILQALQLRPMTAIDALNNFGCFRLAARINDLKAEGHNIITELVEENGKQYARYHLIERKAA